MPIVKMDEKGRIQLPSEVRSAWNLKPKQPLMIELGDERVEIKRVKTPTPETNAMLHDILVNPLRSKKKITRSLLEKWHEEQWSE